MLNAVGVEYIVASEVEVSHSTKKRNYGFWAVHPDNSEQKILLVGSCHSYPLVELPTDLVKEMKSHDILVTEVVKDTNIEEHLKYARKAFKSFNPKVLTERNNKTVGWKTDDQGWEIGDNPWTESQCFSEEIKAFFQENMQDILGEDLLLHHLHPETLLCFLKCCVGKLYGVDNDIIRYYRDSGKESSGLETSEDRKKAISEDVYFRLGHKTVSFVPSYSQDMVSFGLEKLIDEFEVYRSILNADIEVVGSEHHNKKLVESELYLQYHEDGVIPSSAIPSYHSTVGFELTELYKYLEQGRNNIWVPKLMDMFSTNPEKSFTIVVGAKHITTSEDSLITLLETEGFTFKPFVADD
ncbi:MAG: TraB/GumN family protein [Pseudomonadota bacterium]